MRQIYSSAICVRIWLGASNSRSDLAIESLKIIKMDESIVSLHNNARGLSPADPSVYVDLFERPWWRRLWVIQEAVLAKAATIHCGRASISFNTLMQSCYKLRDDFASDYQWLAEHYDSETVQLKEVWKYSFTMMEGVLGYYRSIPNSSQSFLVACLLAGCRIAEYVDARDRVYGLLGLLPGDFKDSIYPDYGASVTSSSSLDNTTSP